MEKNNRQISKRVKWAIVWALAIWGFFSFLLLAGEDDQHNPMPTGRFLMIKAGAMASFLLCFYTGKRLHKAGYLPEELDEENDL